MDTICVAIITYNGGTSIKNTINSWKPHVDSIKVYVDSKTTDKTVEECGNNFSGYFDFESFSESRNRVLDKIFLENYSWSLMIDDSYELFAGADFRNNLESINCFAMKIISNSKIYTRVIGFRTKYKIRFTGAIHEVLAVEFDKILDGPYIKDISYPDHIQRTLDRVDYDIKCLEGYQDDRSLYYLSNAYIQKYLKKEMLISEVIKSLYSRILCPSENYEETFKTYINLGNCYHIIKKIDFAIKAYTNAALVFPARAGEAFYNCYLISGKEYYLMQAKKNKLGKCNLGVDNKIYEEIKNK